LRKGKALKTFVLWILYKKEIIEVGAVGLWKLEIKKLEIVYHKVVNKDVLLVETLVHIEHVLHIAEEDLNEFVDLEEKKFVLLGE
jgi:hypothetical protein